MAGTKKILFLILASDGPVYTQLQDVWRAYIHSRPEEIEAYFYKANPALPTDYSLEGDTLTVKCPESLQWVAKKFQLALKAFEGRLDDYRAICRPNLSSFFILSRYLDAMKLFPHERACMAKEHRHPSIFPTGAGFTITPDVARAILSSPFKQPCIGGDDVAVGAVLKEMGIPIQNVPRVDITHRAHREIRLREIETRDTAFHVRVKHETPNRIEEDMEVHTELLRRWVPAPASAV
jgi:hypothetical protein